ncbi:outer membrane biogenesis protein BamB [Novipirellula galeiformis]|uniref:Outer membrane biogenesis protein BamB n=1 Tax=Novipirellula galeiformis TaxID=2528004 RepID=A0A5C6CGW2_9BACT|nr:PQQ-binding-like beta-propeller repeat protein [Novipirellula galeiformis]TWU22521.1 outer membrane biogenesis protein BamB [Novipirellula galeiformis]
MNENRASSSAAAPSSHVLGLVVTESNQAASPDPAAGSEPPSDNASQPDDASARVIDREPNYLLRMTVVAIVAGLMVYLLQRFVSERDHQNANLFSFGVIGVALLILLTQLFRLAQNHGHRLLVPIAVVVVTALLATLIRFDGFSGEMMPQFKPRFWNGNQPERPSLVTGSLQTLTPLEESESTVALEGSSGFLGNNRTGFIAQRHFQVPRSEAEVEVLWNQGIGEGWSGFAIANDRAITLEQRDQIESVSCYRLGDGSLLWGVNHQARHEHPLGGIGPRSTPTIVGDRVYALGATGKLWCIDLNTGEEIWTADLLELAGWNQTQSETAIPWGRSASPLIVDGLCVVPFGGSRDPAIPPSDLAKSGRSLIAFDAASGEIRWTAGEDQISYASPITLTLGGERQLVSVNETTISGHRIQDGFPLWSIEWPGQTNTSANCSTVTPAGVNRFLVGKGYGGGSALAEVKRDSDATWNAQSVWRSGRILKTKFADTVVVGETAYALSNGSLEAVAIDDGKRRWQQPRGERSGQGQILVCEDTIVVQNETGEILFVELNEDRYSVLLRLSALDSKTWNVPTIAGRHLIVRNDREVICFLLPERESS